MKQETQMAQEPKAHTPTPWKYEHGFICGGIEYLADLNYCGLSSDEQDANGGFIIRAVNNHDARQKLLNTSLDLLLDICDSRAIERFSAIGVSRIKSHIADLRSALSPAQEQVNET